MSSREKILATCTANKPALVDLPQLSDEHLTHYNDKLDQFKLILEGIGGKVVALENIEQVKEEIAAHKQSGEFVVDTVFNIDDALKTQTSFDLERVDRAYLKATLGVAENGSVWLYEAQMGNRLLPFICQHLFILLDKATLVDNMYQAYQKLQVQETGFGVFIAGPSKTADIEQSLVIGAHGARSLTVYLV